VKYLSSVLLTLVLLDVTLAAGTPANAFHYVSPRPGAQLAAKETSIILRPQVPPAGGVVAFPSIHVQGTISGPHPGEWIAAERGETLIFRPQASFAAGEVIFVTMDDFSFRFTVSPKTADPGRSRIAPCDPEHCEAASSTNAPEIPAAPAPRGGFSLPQSFPAPTVSINDNPAPGYILAAPRYAAPHYAAMLDNAGSPVFFREFSEPPGDFKKQESVGLYSYLQGSSGFHVVGEDFELLDTFAAENGYSMIDGHDFQILPNGNVFIAIQDLQPVDMSQIVEGGDPNAIVRGFVMQEQDPSHNVVFQWRSWDHFEITEAVGIDFTAPFIDYVHFNSFELDTDGNILISCRELGEVTKIDRQTGDIIWRLGGSRNEFTLVGDTQWFSRQHDARRTATGTVTVFDNGVLNAPQESRVVEYALDEANKIATLAWEFRNDPPLYGSALGNAQRLSNGNTLISWGDLGIVTEVRSDGTKAFEMAFDNYWTYRAFRFDWNGAAARPELWHELSPVQVSLHFTKFGDPDVAQFHIYRGSSPEPTTRVGSTPDNWFDLDVFWPEILYVRVTAADSTGENESPFSNELEIIVPIPVDAPVVDDSQSRIALYQNHPNPFAPSTTISFTLSEQSLVDLSVYDVRGRLVTRLAHDVMVPGRNDAVWDGTDARGRRVGSGVYFYRLKAGDQKMTKRMALLR
jgi:hypothetical protein